MITLAGTIGAGKTSMTDILSHHLGTKAFYEPVDDNPVLPLYYQDPKKYGFLLQIFFLNRRFKMIKKAMQDDNNVLDRSIYEDALFTDINWKNGNMTDEEHDIYHSLLDNMMEELPYAAHKKAPDLMVYVEVSLDKQLDHIKARGRDYEQIDNNPGLLHYYRQLQSEYRHWFKNYNKSAKIKIDGDHYDFVNNEQARQVVLNQIDTALKVTRK